MNYLFTRLETIFSALLFATNDYKSFEDLTYSLKEEVDSLQTRFKEIYFQPTSESCFQNFIEVHHASLVTMIDTLSNHIDIRRTRKRLMPDTYNETEFLITLLSAYNHVNQLLEFVHNLFGKFIPISEPIPKLSLQVPLEDIKHKMSLIKNALTNPDLKYSHFILSPFVHFTSSHKSASWHNLFYCKAVYKEFKGLLELNSRFTNEDILWLLYSLNFNTVDFYKAFTGYIMEKDPENYLESLYHFRRVARQTITLPKIAYKIDFPRIDEMILKWIEEEIHFIEKTSQYKLPLVAEQINKPQTSTEKIFSNLTVAELAYLYKLLNDSKALKIENHKEFFGIIARTYRTGNSENISSQSLRSKFYKPEDSVKTAVKSRLIALLNEINKNHN